jgi:hypothetical protein
MMIPKERLSRLCISQPKVKWSVGKSSCNRCNTTEVGTSAHVLASGFGSKEASNFFGIGALKAK